MVLLAISVTLNDRSITDGRTRRNHSLTKRDPAFELGGCAIVDALMTSYSYSFMCGSIEIQPAAGKHAIEVMALAVEWDRPLAPEVLAQMEDTYRLSKDLQRLLPVMDRIQGMSLHFGDDGTTVSTPESGGLQLSQIDDDGKVVLTVSIRPDLIACNCLDYDRWNTVKPKAIEVLTPLVECGLITCHFINAVGLQYQDSFRIQTSEPLMATRRLFREEGPWLSPHAWTTDGAWHVHQGWFSLATSGRRVHNLLNIDFIAEKDYCVVRINGQHRIQAVDKSGREPKPLALADISDALDGLHLDNKIALRRLLSDSVCVQIGLTIPEET